MTATTMHLDALLRAASERLAAPFSLIVHLGAGSGAAELYASLPYVRLVLAEGETVVADELRARCAATLPGAEVEPVVVAPTAGPVTWFQYNLRPLSGPADAMALRSFYPRLEQVGAQQVQAVGVASWLSGLVSDPRSSGSESTSAASSLLVFDVPGQESALLDALPDDALLRFGWIVVRRWRHSNAARKAEAVHERLVSAGFDHVLPIANADRMADAQIVQELYRFDEREAKLQRLEKERDDLRSFASTLEQMIADARRSLHEAERGRQVAESALNDSRAREARLSDEITTLTGRQRESAAATERHVQLAADAKAQAARLDTERTELQRLCDRLRTELQAAETARGQADERLRQAEREASERQACETELASRIAVLEAQQTQLTSSAELASNDAREARSRASQLAGELAELRKTSDALREKLRSAEASVIELGRKHQEADALARTRAQELETASKQLGDERKNVRTQAQRIEKLESELMDAQFRLETLQQELLKAEGQLEVVKDLLLNENTL